jgi:hypothetical protein
LDLISCFAIVFTMVDSFLALWPVAAFVDAACERASYWTAAMWSL